MNKTMLVVVLLLLTSSALLAQDARWEESANSSFRVEESQRHPEREILLVRVPSQIPRGRGMCIDYAHDVFGQSNRGKLTVTAHLMRATPPSGQHEIVESVKLGSKKVRGTGVSFCRQLRLEVEKDDMIALEFSFRSAPDLSYPESPYFRVGFRWQ